MIITSRSDAGQPAAPAAGGWQATRAQTALATQFLEDEEQYLSANRSDIGRQVGANERELFVSCAPGEALQQQFQHLNLEFVAVHDIATRSSRQLVAGLAAAAKRSVQKLLVRRQGYGTALATLDFVDLPLAGGRRMRLFSTDAESDAAERHAIARALLAHSQLGVVMVGDMPPNALADQFRRWQAELLQPHWPNRHLLLLPLAAANALASQGVELARGSGVQVRTTPRVTRAADAWAFIESTWKGLAGDAAAAPATAAPSPANAPRTRPAPAPSGLAMAAVSRPMSLDLKPMPTVTGRLEAVAGAARDEALVLYMKQVGELTGMVSCCAFDIATGHEVMHAGADPWQVELARHGGELLVAMTATSRDLGLGREVPEAAITLGGHHLLLRAVPHRPGLALHAVFEKSGGNLTLLRLKLERLDEVLAP